MKQIEGAVRCFHLTEDCREVTPDSTAKSNFTGREKKFKIRLTSVSNLSEALQRLR